MKRTDYNKECAKRVYDYMVSLMDKLDGIVDKVEYMDMLDYLYDIIYDDKEMSEYIENNS